MGKILLGILGGIKGKVGPVIGATWKGIDYIKGYAIPANPNTVPQQTQRALFSFVLGIAQLVLTTVIQAFWINRESGMSEYNSFMRANLNAVTAADDYDEVVMTLGNLEGALLTAHTYNAGTGECIATWDGTIMGNGLATDSANLTVIDEDNNIAFSAVPETRDNDEVRVNIGAGRIPGSTHYYMFFSRGSGVDLVVSNSDYGLGVAP